MKAVIDFLFDLFMVEVLVLSIAAFAVLAYRTIKGKE